MAAERHALRIYCDDTFDLHIFRNKYERNRPVYPSDRARPCRRIRLEDDPEAQEMQRFLMNISRKWMKDRTIKANEASSRGPS